MKNNLELVFPTEEYREQVMEYLQEHLDNNELEMHGVGGLDRIKDFDKWLQKIRNDLSEETIEKGRVPATLFLAIRKEDNKIVGMIQIRHKLNEKLLQGAGHIGDGVRPSERRKGYATEMIKLALEECKKLGISRVLMGCYKDNIGSRKSIINNAGVLESEIQTEDGRIDQKYWISLKKRYASRTKEKSNILEINQKMINIDNDEFKGDIFFDEIIKVKEKHIVSKDICIEDNNYKWLEFYDYNAKIKLTAIYNEKNEIIEWYFDIARSIGKENGDPYEDDLYLDVVVTPHGKIMLLDEDELKEAFERHEMTKEEFDEAYKIAINLMKKLEGRTENLKKFTDKYLKIMIEREEII